jgi:hypothetical protein
MKFTRHSPSSLNLFASCPSMFVLEKILGRRQPVGLAAYRGTAVEDGISAGLFDPDKPVAECVEIAVQKFSQLAAFNSDERKEKFTASLAPMVEGGLLALRPYGVPSGSQGFIEWKPDDLQYPIVGYYDFAWDHHGIIIDLKTTEMLPSAIKTAHARQVALYTGGNLEGRLHYQTPKKQATYLLENVAEHRACLHQMALRCEAFLALSDDPEFFVNITCPDLESFYFGTAQARQAAFEIWKI